MSKTPVRGSPRRGLAAATFGFFIGFAGVVVYGPAASEFEEAMGLSGIMLGLLVGAPNLIGSLLRIPFGAWTDDVGARKPFLILLGLSIVGMAGLSAILVLWYPDGLTIELYPAIFLFGALSGCGIATFSVGSAQTAYWYPADRQGTALAVFAGLGNSSPGIFTVVIPVALAVLGLTTTYVVWLAFLVVGTAIYATIAVDPYSFQLRARGLGPDRARRRAEALGQELFPGGDAVGSIEDAASLKRTWALVALYFTSFGGFLALTVWLPSYWTSLHGIEARTAGVLTAVGFILLATFVRIPGGALSDRVGGERAATASFAVVGLGAICMILTPRIGALASEFGVALVGMILLATGIGVANAATFQLLPLYVPDAVGGASGLVGGLGAFGGFVVPPILGVFVDVYGVTGYATGFVVYLGLATIGVALSVGLYATVEEG
ncbi:MFS transporter [Halovivax sp.]|uniref:MFS transporter n=1 Tax=Halovivax sp. TaxID=1935978 RepID=UPI0025C28CC0|nr:MFS transporter [Halovivax sp.]